MRHMKVIRVKEGGRGKRRKEGRQRREGQNNWETNKGKHTETDTKLLWFYVAYVYFLKIIKN